MDDATYTAVKTVMEFLCPLLSLVLLWPVWLIIINSINERKALRRKNMQGEKPYVPAQVQQAKTPIFNPPPDPPHIQPVGSNPTKNKGPTVSAELDQYAKGRHKNCQLIKDLLKQKSVVEQDIIKIVQNGGSIADIKRKHGSEEAKKADSYVETLREEFMAVITPMVEAGLTDDEIAEILGHTNAISLSSFPASAEETHRQTPTPKKASFSQTVTTSGRRKADMSSGVALQNTPDLFPAPEGGRKRKTSYAIVRSAKLRKAAIEIHGRNCIACLKNFDEIYGVQLAKGYIEVHHLNSISTGERTTDPATDLIPLCSNCHKMADRLSPPPRTISGLRSRLFPTSNLPSPEALPTAEVTKSLPKVKIDKIRQKKPKN
jgi:HNH endonuclease